MEYYVAGTGCRLIKMATIGPRKTLLRAFRSPRTSMSSRQFFEITGKQGFCPEKCRHLSSGVVAPRDPGHLENRAGRMFRIHHVKEQMKGI